ncbi:hypothetical protein [Streptomyces griseus]|uniref:hypothetical protein n=1 Tax=Streptomyces griseus TaxID=1911 RepID=UPI00341040E5
MCTTEPPPRRRSTSGDGGGGGGAPAAEADAPELTGDPAETLGLRSVNLPAARR